MSRVQIDCLHPERCVIGHPFNPPHLVPLVEVVGSEKAGPAAVARALAFYTAIGKQPIHIRREVPGMSPTGCSRRCGGRRCIWWPNGVASVADVDTAISAGSGRTDRLGTPPLLAS
jgi:carnitine 3-dehydrogenase